MKARLADRDPELFALLASIAADPRARLLRQAAGAEHQAALGASLRSSTWTRAERHLLAARRDELRNLLVWACLRALYAGPSWKSRLHHGLTRTRRLEMIEPRAWKIRATLALDQPHVDDEAYGLLRRCVGERRGTRASSLALAALHIAPHDSARIDLGLALHREGRPAAALHVLAGVVASTRSELYGSIAYENIGLVRSQCGELELAREAYAESARAREERPSAAFGWLAASLRCEDRRSALQAAARLSEVAGVDDPTLTECVAALARARQARAWTATRAASKLAGELIDRVPAVAGKVLHVFR